MLKNVSKVGIAALGLSLCLPIVGFASTTDNVSKENSKALKNLVGFSYVDSITDGVDSQSSTSSIYWLEHNAKVIQNFWPDYNAAMDAKAAGDYRTAAAKLESLIPSFIQYDTKETVGRVFGHLGECYARLGRYDAAAACFDREAYYWSTVAGNDAQQSVIAAKRRAEYVKSEMTLYVRTTDKSKSTSKYFGAKYEPVQGAILGAFGEGDQAVHDSSNISNKFYINDFPAFAGKDHGAYLLYYPMGMPLDHYETHLSIAKEKGKIMEIALEPTAGMDSVYSNEAYLTKLAKDMESYGGKFMLRFASEMNDNSNGWYTTDTQKYINAFRYVSGIFKKNAPSVAIIWSPLFYPPNTIDSYYPGDEYVDYVGISSYKSWLGSVDPVGEGMDRSRWSQQLDTFYKTYGQRKPIIISEGGASYEDPSTGGDMTDFAAYQTTDFYTYLPMRYPNIKMVLWYDNNGEGEVYKYRLSEKPLILNAYKNAIQDEYYLSDINDAAKITQYYYPINGNDIASGNQQLNMYVKYAKDRNVARVEYKVNNEVVGNATAVPYKVNCDFTKYKGNTVTITANAYDSNSNLLLTKNFIANIK